MGKATRILLIFGGVLIVAAGIGVWLLISNLDSIVKRVVEEVGSEALGTNVSLSSAAVSLQEASATLRGLKIANPSGYKTKNAFELGGIEVAIDPASVTTNEIVLPKIVVDQAKLNFEQQGTSNNLQALMNNMDTGSDQPAGDQATELRFVIKEFRLTDAGMTLSDERLGKPISFTLPDIVVRNIGRAGAGVTAEEAAEQIMQPVIDKTMDAAKARVRQEVEGLAKKELDKQKDRALDSVRDKLFGR